MGFECYCSLCGLPPKSRYLSNDYINDITLHIKGVYNDNSIGEYYDWENYIKKKKIILDKHPEYIKQKKKFTIQWEKALIKGIDFTWLDDIIIINNKGKNIGKAFDFAVEIWSVGHQFTSNDKMYYIVRSHSREPRFPRERQLRRLDGSWYTPQVGLLAHRVCFNHVNKYLQKHKIKYNIFDIYRFFIPGEGADKSYEVKGSPSHVKKVFKNRYLLWGQTPEFISSITKKISIPLKEFEKENNKKIVIKILKRILFLLFYDHNFYSGLI